MARRTQNSGRGSGNVLWPDGTSSKMEGSKNGTVAAPRSPADPASTAAVFRSLTMLTSRGMCVSGVGRRSPKLSGCLTRRGTLTPRSLNRVGSPLQRFVRPAFSHTPAAAFAFPSALPSFDRPRRQPFIQPVFIPIEKHSPGRFVPFVNAHILALPDLSSLWPSDDQQVTTVPCFLP